ncbi:TetR/AcrR family transcriptional regulator [Lachnoclostridium phytofermentans]|uniref:TetR/AcrR family transcriptional regulator n=1 Tax=Lachnoclostridium phytofermentans TaxID=66219 RepID=UPI0000D81805|nr:TetR/AcrR family transcriptional regulator [Lachnoclostridium phytofermentans]
MRRIKEPEVRKSEILDAAQKLFAEKGYSKTTVTDILNVHGLSKGVFYYYFKSKEEVMDAIIQRIVDAEVEGAKRIVSSPDLTPPQKLCAILLGQGQTEENVKSKEDMIDQFHMAENAEMHQKSMVQSVKQLVPVIAEIISQDKKIFKTDYPQETVAFFLAAGQFIFDQGLFQWNEEELSKLVMAFVELIEKTLGVSFTCGGKKARGCKRYCSSCSSIICRGSSDFRRHPLWDYGCANCYRI